MKTERLFSLVKLQAADECDSAIPMIKRVPITKSTPTWNTVENILAGSKYSALQKNSPFHYQELEKLL